MPAADYVMPATISSSEERVQHVGPKRDVSWLLPSSGPVSLAVLRIAAGVAAALEVRALAGFQIPPPELWVPPPGTAWLSFMPANQALLAMALWIAGASAVAVAVGYRPRLFSIACASGLFYAGWLTTLTGKVDHSHHLMWMLVILAVSPCANAWALRRETASGSFAAPVFGTMVILGLIYFGAGLQKLLSTGYEWAWSDNMSNMMLQFAWKNDVTPIRLLQTPIASRLLGTAALAFELFFLPLVVWPKSRRYVWPIGLLFHWATWIVLGISFITLQFMYVAFVPWDKAPARDTTKSQRYTLVVLVSLIGVFALSGVDEAWPIAAYPGFEGIRSVEITDYEIVTDSDRYLATDAPVEMATETLLTLFRATMAHGDAERLAEWLEAEQIWLLTIDVRTGKEINRVLIFP